jgi:arylsulfatase A-like enzyme
LLNTVGRSGAVRAGDWKLVRNGQSGIADDETNSEPTAAQSKETKKQKRLAARNAPDVIELFNLATDPSETKNLATEQPDKVRELTAKLDQFAQEAVPPILKPEQETKTNR